MDRFYIPDWSPESDAPGDSARPRSRHERWPGVLLFRSARYTDSSPDRRVLVTSLVFETPTAGIHQEAFAEAVRIASNWPRASTSPVTVLGPTFSGSTVSLSNAIDAFPALNFRVVTGSATSRKNLSLRRTAPHVVTFNSTVHPDDEVVDKLVEYLGRTVQGTDRMALLVEGDTSYGSELKGQEEGSGLRSWPPSTRILPFPLQISRLRSAATVQGQTSSTNTATSRLLGLSLGQSGASTDQLPSLTPGTTSAAVELELAQILDVITRDHITTVGLLATDTRDKLFLAQQLARRSATVRLFTIESDLFYVHPDYSRYVRGMVVASSYPLFVQNQKWVSGTSVNQQFSTTMAQGVYNAMITLLNYDKGGRVLPGRPAGELLDYRLPGTSIQQPPIWISVAGHDAIWPVAWYRPKGTDYLQPMPGSTNAGVLTAYVSAWVVSGVGALGAIVILHVLLYCYSGRIVRGNVRLWPFFRFFADSGFERRQPYLFVAFTVLSVAWGYTCTIMALTIFYLQPSRLGRGVDSLRGGLSAIMLVALLACTAHLAWRTAHGAARRFSTESVWKALGQLQYGLMLVALFCALIAGAAGGTYLWSVFRNTDGIVYFVERATHPGNGVSPTLPLMLVVAMVYLWAFAHLRRLSAVSGTRIEASLLPLAPLAGALEEPVVTLRRFIDAAVQALPPVLTGVVLATVLIAAFLTWLHPLSSPEPQSFTYAFRAAWLVLQILLWLAFAHIAFFWHTLRKAMHAFSGTPIVGAFGRLSPEFFHDRLSPRQPDDADIRRMTHTARQLGFVLGGLKDSGKVELSQALRDVPGQGEPADVKPGTVWAETPEWTRLCKVVGPVAVVVAESWNARARATALSTIDIDAEAKEGDDMQRWLMRAEEFLAMHVLLVVRELLSRLVNVFFFVMVAVMLMVALQQSFPFQPRQELLGMAWIYVLSAVILILTIVVQMEHDDVLSAFASTKSGSVSWDAALWSKIFIYGVIPVATVFAAQFPGIGSTLLDWLTPVQKALP